MRIDGRFAGPPGAANGGWLAGLLGGDGPAEVTIRRPVPVEVDLVRTEEGLEDAEGTLLAAVRPTEPLDASGVPAVSVDAARAAAAATPLAARHPFPGCFGCGPAHASGLHCLAGPVDDRVWAVDWTPEDASPPFVWAALDCPSSAPVCSPDGVPPFVLGRIAAQLLAPVSVGEPHAVVAWAAGSEGRRRYSRSVVLSADGRPCAVAYATWVALS